MDVAGAEDASTHSTDSSVITSRCSCGHLAGSTMAGYTYFGSLRATKNKL